MKTPWHTLLRQYGIAIAALIVMVAGGIILLSVVGFAILIAKISVFIK